ncbi:hypothetical protein ACLMJK_004351 [Lecanora helva]
MLLVHQTGSLRVGEVVRSESSIQDGTPEFEPNLKAGGSWSSSLSVPENIRETAGKVNVKRGIDGSIPKITWIIEISSQIIFSTSAAVHYELLIGRDTKSVELGFSSLTGHAVATPGQLQDHQQSRRNKGVHSNAQPKGVFSNAISLVVDDTESLWNKPAFPEWDDEREERGKTQNYPDPGEEDIIASGSCKSRPGTSGETSKVHPGERKRKRVHLVVLTHGLHSNLGSDMLYMKESIDAAAREAREAVRKRKAERKWSSIQNSPDLDKRDTTESKVLADQSRHSSVSPLDRKFDLHAGAEIKKEEEEEEEEEVIVRGFAHNVARTEKGIQYLGKRLAKWILAITYPDQPSHPVKKSLSKKISRVFTGDQALDAQQGSSSHTHSSIHLGPKKADDLAYRITSISFIAHSLGGLTQTYAIAYIHKHSPNFFNEIKPINFVAMAAPFLGLSNENPLYVRFALDFGLVGRTGQDLGLTWRTPTMVRSGWGAMIGGIGSDAQKAQRHLDPGSKPLLRILPTGHTHHVLKLFRNRTVYSNVVNDGIVPLRTSCLLFLDWSGLGRVEKARRENGVIGTMAGWGWSEITGTNKSSRLHLNTEQDSETWSHSDMSGDEGRAEVPQPEENAVRDDTTAPGNETRKGKHVANGQEKPFQDEEVDAIKIQSSSPQEPSNPLTGFLSFLRPSQPKQPKPHQQSPKQSRIYKRSQTLKADTDDGTNVASESSSPLGTASPSGRPGAVRGDSVMEDTGFAPPKTTIFEAAGDVLNPPLPTKDFLINPQGRPRTIFHDRVYHPEDIPQPQMKKPRPSLKRSFSSEMREGPSRSNTIYDGQMSNTPDTSSMKVEEKIARAYHHGLSWRKVLVRLEPDAHNNMIVRRMFSNAYGWPVVKHLVDTHFSDSYAATTADVDEPNKERAKPISEVVGEHGEEVHNQNRQEVKRTDSELKEVNDNISELTDMGDSSMNSSKSRRQVTKKASAQWDDSMFDHTDDDEEMDPKILRTRGHIAIPDSYPHDDAEPQGGTSQAEIANFLTRSPPPVSPQDDSHTFQPAKVTSPPGGTTSVGLGKSVEERLASSGKARRQTLENSGDGTGHLADDVTRIRIEDGQ